MSTSIDAANRCTTDRHLAWQVRESTTTTWWSPWLHCCTTMTRPNYDFSWLFHIDPIHTAVNIDFCNYIWIMYNLYCRTKSFNHWYSWSTLHQFWLSSLAASDISHFLFVFGTCKQSADWFYFWTLLDIKLKFLKIFTILKAISLLIMMVAWWFKLRK